MTKPNITPPTKQIPASPKNYTVGRGSKKVSLIVVHVMDGSLTGTDTWFQNPASQVSAHYGIGNHAELHQYVNETDTAWHAGVWETNQQSIGIEHEGTQPKAPPYWIPTEKQLMVSAQLAASICHRHNITPTTNTILRHSNINPHHALCPGPGFPLETYIEIVEHELTNLPHTTPPALHDTTPTETPVRLFDPTTNKQIGTGTLITGTNKVYIKDMQPTPKEGTP